MSPSTPKRESVRKANQAVSRPEDPATHRERRAARKLRVDELPQGGAMLTPDEDIAEGSETKAALERAARRKS